MRGLDGEGGGLLSSAVPVIGTLLLPLLWMPPIATQIGRFIYLLLMLSIYAAALSVFSVPYGALGIELTANYDERARVMAWRGYLHRERSDPRGFIGFVCHRSSVMKPSAPAGLASLWVLLCLQERWQR